jgi:hypothetical protein
MADEPQQQEINQAAEEFTNALVESYRAASERGVHIQEQNAQLTQDFFNRVIDNLQTQAEKNREFTEELASQQQRATEAGQQLTQESVNAYRDFVGSMFSSMLSATQGAAKEGAEEGARQPQR